MAIEEKEGRLNIKLTMSQVALYLDGTFTSVPDLDEALETASIECEKQNGPQEILIVVDKGF